MRKLILQVAVSLDGYIEGPNGEYDWCLTDQDYGMKAFLQRVDSMFIGRKSYELTQKMDASAMAPFAHLATYVFSTTLSEVKQGDVLIKENIASEVKRIKLEPGKDIWLFGGASLTTSLLKANLVNEISLAVHPLVLGAGKMLFSDIPERMPLQLVDTKSYSSGLVSLTYSVT
ncbi:MAG: dihydrofolate reductase [Flavisolibacter sp.]|jgi:dihydrofolate reductase|nr:dihydrofolate reductase [Flavisolibacter sp.]